MEGNETDPKMAGGSMQTEGISEPAAMAPWQTNVDSGRFRNVKSAERTLALFELFSVQQRPLSVGQISDLLKIPQPSVTMLVGNLVRLGYLEHDRPNRRYLPTIRILLLSSWIHQKCSTEHGLEAILMDLSRETGETVLLGLQNSLYCQYVFVQLPSAPDRLEVRSGMLRPITRTAIGKVLLAMKDDAEISAIARRCNAECGDSLRVNVSEFLASIGEVRANGYASTRGDMTQGASVIAVPFTSPMGNLSLGIGIGGPTERIESKREALIAALKSIGKAMGQPSAVPGAAETELPRNSN